MNSLPPPSFPPEPPGASVPTQPRRRGVIIGLAVLGGAALLAGGVLIGVAVASDDGQPADAGSPVDLATQFDETEITSWFDQLEPFVQCVTAEIEIAELPNDLGTLDDLSEITDDDLERLWDEGVALFTDTYAACSSTLPPEIGEFDLDDFNLDDFEFELGDEMWEEFDLGEFSPHLLDGSLDEMLGEFLDDTLDDEELQNWLDEIREVLPPEVTDLLDE